MNINRYPPLPTTNNTYVKKNPKCNKNNIYIYNEYKKNVQKYLDDNNSNVKELKQYYDIFKDKFEEKNKDGDFKFRGFSQFIDTIEKKYKNSFIPSSVKKQNGRLINFKKFNESLYENLYQPFVRNQPPKKPPKFENYVWNVLKNNCNGSSYLPYNYNDFEFILLEKITDNNDFVKNLSDSYKNLFKGDDNNEKMLMFFTENDLNELLANEPNRLLQEQRKLEMNSGIGGKRKSRKNKTRKNKSRKNKSKK